MQSLSVWLACDEKASFRQGTDTRTECRRVYFDRCFLREQFEVQQGMPFEGRCQILCALRRDAFLSVRSQRGLLEADRKRQRGRLARLRTRVSSCRQSLKMARA